MALPMLMLLKFKDKLELSKSIPLYSGHIKESMCLCVMYFFIMLLKNYKLKFEDFVLNRTQIHNTQNMLMSAIVPLTLS